MQDTDSAAGPSAGDLRLQRNLKIVVAVLAIMLAVGMATIVGRILYLASRTPAQPAAAPAPAAVSVGVLPKELSMQLPSGAQVKSISLSGDRLAVHYALDAAGGAGEGIAIIDLRTGEPVASVGLKR
jgi:uncharacterized membrane protein